MSNPFCSADPAIIRAMACLIPLSQLEFKIIDKIIKKELDDLDLFFDQFSGEERDYIINRARLLLKISDSFLCIVKNSDLSIKENWLEILSQNSEYLNKINEIFPDLSEIELAEILSALAKNNIKDIKYLHDRYINIISDQNAKKIISEIIKIAEQKIIFYNNALIDH